MGKSTENSSAADAVPEATGAPDIEQPIAAEDPAQSDVSEPAPPEAASPEEVEAANPEAADDADREAAEAAEAAEREAAEQQSVEEACRELGIVPDGDGGVIVDLLVAMSGTESKSPGDPHSCDPAEAVRLVRAGYAKPQS